MLLVDTVIGLQRKLDSLRSQGAKVGFVPTMGALHQGHLSLVRESLTNNDVTVVSIFVNPTQFNDHNDFDKYPRTVERDAALLEQAGVDIVFAPTEKEIYPAPDTRQFDFGSLDKVMEGKYRPGHFNGVAQVVSRLFEIVKPDKAYFGEKDFQQLAIIRQMVKQLHLPVEIVGMPIVRQEDGLAMSSRNERLTAEQRVNAIRINRILQESRNWMDECSVADFISRVAEQINKVDDLRIEYFDIVDGDTLQPISDWNSSDYVVGCITVFCGDVRLIDNITYKTRKA